MTYEEIKLAVECCTDEEVNWCVECPMYKHDRDNDFCQEDLLRSAFDLITRQKVEIERLKKPTSASAIQILAEQAANSVDRTPQFISEIKTEAIKEFAEEIKNKLWDFPTMSDEDGEFDYVCMESLIDFIDKCVKEKVGDNDDK